MVQPGHPIDFLSPEVCVGCQRSWEVKNSLCPALNPPLQPSNRPSTPMRFNPRILHFFPPSDSTSYTSVEFLFPFGQTFPACTLRPVGGDTAASRAHITHRPNRSRHNLCPSCRLADNSGHNSHLIHALRPFSHTLTPAKPSVSVEWSCVLP